MSEKITKTIYKKFTGIAQWCKLFKPDPEYDNFQIEVQLSDEAWETLKDLGVQLQPTKNDPSYVKFRRPNTKLIKGEPVDFGPPDVLDSKGQPWPQDQIIGNGSKVEVDVCFYPAGRYVGHRLNTVKVLEHVPYERPSEDQVEETPPSTESKGSRKRGF